MLIDVLRSHPGLCGVLFDVPEVIALAEKLVADADMAGRIQLVAGSFFEAVPPGGDAYPLSNILHDWPDAECLRILQACRAAMPPAAKLIVVEGVVPSDTDAPSAVRYGDLRCAHRRHAADAGEFERCSAEWLRQRPHALLRHEDTIVEAVAL